MSTAKNVKDVKAEEKKEVKPAEAKNTAKAKVETVKATPMKEAPENAPVAKAPVAKVEPVKKPEEKAADVKPKQKKPVKTVRSVKSSKPAAPKAEPANANAAMKGLEDAVSMGRDNVEAFVKASSVLAKGVQDINKIWFDLAQSNLESGVMATKAVLSCESLPELVEVQADYAKKQYDKVVADSRKLTDASKKLADEASKPLQERANSTLEVIVKPIAA